MFGINDFSGLVHRPFFFDTPFAFHIFSIISFVSGWVMVVVVDGDEIAFNFWGEMNFDATGNTKILLTCSIRCNRIN